MRRLPSTGAKLIPGLFFLSLLLLWQAAVSLRWVPEFILPSPVGILRTMATLYPEIALHLLTTLREAGYGLAFAVLLAVILALGMDLSTLLRRALYPLLVVSQTIPTLVLAPLFALWFGFGELPKVLVVVLTCFFPVVVSLSDGFSSLEPDMINLLRSMGAKRRQVFFLLKLPAALVPFFSGLRIAAAYSTIGAVIAEWLGGENGLGVYMIRARHSYNLEKVFAVIVIIVVLSLVLFQVIAVLQYLLMPWQRRSNQNREAGNYEANG